MPKIAILLACVAGVKGEGERGIWAREGERKGTLLPSSSRVVSRPYSLPLPFRMPATHATILYDGEERGLYSQVVFAYNVLFFVQHLLHQTVAEIGMIERKSPRLRYHIKHLVELS